MQNAVIDVTLFTVELQVDTFEEKILVEIAGKAPTGFVMAFGTIGTVGSIVYIAMTSLTIFGLQFGKVIIALAIIWLLSIPGRSRLMAFGTLDLLMLALEFIVGLVVIELFALFKTLRQMTARARPAREFLIEHVLMLVDVTLFAKSFLSPFKHKEVPALWWFGC